MLSNVDMKKKYMTPYMSVTGNVKGAFVQTSSPSITSGGEGDEDSDLSGDAKARNSSSGFYSSYDMDW